MGLGAALKSSWPILSREWDEVFVLIITRKGEQAAKASAAAALFFDKKPFFYKKPCIRIIIRQWLK